MVDMIIMLINRIKYEIKNPFFDCDLEEIDFEL